VIKSWKYCVVVGLLILSSASIAQVKDILKSDDSTDMTFSGTKINPYAIEYDTTGKISFSGYIDTYYAYYTDTVGPGGYSKFPTCAPRHNQIGINILQISAKYISTHFRATATLFGGDCPQSSWSSTMNYIQEANAGFRIVKKLWLDAGFFRTHFGLESIQPRENMTMSLATTTYFEPYFLSGLKLTWQHSDKLAFQLNAFNSYNQFVETNKNKAVGFSVSYSPSSKLSTSFSTILCDESPTGSIARPRLYNNFILTYKSHKWIIGFEGNFGSQKNSVLSDSTKTAFMFSSLVAAKYRLSHKWATYARCEIFSDPDEILTGPVINQDHHLVGIDIMGITCGFEYKPIPNSYFRVETRYLQTKESESIFYYNNQSRNYRYEFIAGLGFWF